MVWVSTETRVVWGHTETGVVWTSTCTVWISVWIFTETKATFPRGVSWLSVCSVWSPRYGGKVGGQEGAEGVTPKSIPLEHKSGIFHREKKGNTYATSTHFPYSLKNQSNCKTVLYLRDPQTGHCSLSSNGYRAMQYHIGRPGVSSLSPGDQIYPSFSGYNSKEWGWNC